MPSETRPADPSRAVSNTKWLTTWVIAICNDDGCAWKYRGTTQGATVAQARRHALASGHDVRLERRQVRWTEVIAGE